MRFAWCKEEGTLKRQDELDFFGEDQGIIEDVYELFKREGTLGNPWDGPHLGLKFLRENVNGEGYTIMVILNPVQD